MATTPATTATTATTAPTGTRNGKALSVGLWAAQILLAVAYGLFGTMKASQPIDQLAHLMAWVPTAPIAFVRALGVAEILGAIGIILPAATRIAPRLTVVTAACFILLQVLAIAFHASRGETAHTVALNIILVGLAGFVFWGRSTKIVILPRGGEFS